jgi:glycosyltransferase involved in cell wall biosynthesis
VEKPIASALNPPIRPKLWLINLYFGVGIAPTGPLAESAAQALWERGWDVEVLASRASYNVSRGRSAHRFRGRVVWLHTIFRDSEGLMGLLLCWLNFYIAVAWRVFTRPLPAKVIMLTTPPLLHLLLVVRRWFSRHPVDLILWTQDTYPEILAAVHLLSVDSWAYCGFKALECWSVSRVDRVLVLDRGMERILAEHGARSIHVVPNWEIARNLQTEFDPHDPFVEQVRAAKLHYRYIVIYTGNYGWGHDVHLVTDYLRDHPGQRQFYFIFVGGGVKWPELRQSCAGIGGAAIVSYLPRGVLQAVVSEAHFGLVALEQACVGLMSPSKIHNYLALGKPLLYLGTAGSNVAEAIADFACGFTIPEHGSIAWNKFAARVADPDFPYEDYARNARQAFTQRYEEDIAVQKFCTCVG